MPIQPIKAPKLYQRIAQEIEQLIAAGTFKPGARLPAERQLAQSLDVSRSSLREALSELEMAGVLEIRIGSGAYVKRRPPARTARANHELPPFDVLRARRIVEAETAALAALQSTPAQHKQLAAALAQLGREMRANRMPSPADRDFHVCIAHASGNAALAMLVERLWLESQGPLGQRMEALYVTRGRKRDNIEEHRAVFGAIVAGDPVAARRAMRRHLLNAERQRMSVINLRAAST